MQGASSLDAAMQRFLNGTMLCLARCSAILTHRMQVKRRKGANQGLTAKKKAPRMANRARAVQIALLPVQTTSRRPNFLVNVLFSRNQAKKLLIYSRKPTCSTCLGYLAQLKQNTKPIQFPLRETEEQKEVY